MSYLQHTMIVYFESGEMENQYEAAFNAKLNIDPHSEAKCIVFDDIGIAVVRLEAILRVMKWKLACNGDWILVR